MNTLNMLSRKKPSNVLHISVIVGRTFEGDFRAVVPDVPRKFNQGYKQVPLVAHGRTSEEAVRGLEKALSQWLYEKLDDGEALPRFSEFKNIDNYVKTGQSNLQDAKAVELVFTEDQIFGL